MFPLFRLPMVALKEVFRSMSIEELFLFSLLSNKVKQAIQASIPKGCVPVSFRFQHDLKVSVGSCRFVITCSKSNLKQPPAIKYKIENKKFGLYPHEDCYHIEPENDLDGYGFKSIIVHHFVEVFNSSISISGLNATFAVKMIRCFNKRRTEIRKVEISSTLTKSEYTEILDSCSAIDVLCIDAGPIANFQYTPLTPFTTKSVTLCGSWMSLEDFMQCERLHLYEDHFSHWTPERVNTFLKTWIIIDCKLENISLCLRDQESFPVAVEGLTDRLIQDKRSIEVRKKDGKRFKIFHEEFFLKVEPIR